MKIIISAGGTGGHIYPALSLLKKFEEKESNLEVIYVGSHNRMEKEIVKNLGIKYHEIEIYGLSKTQLFRNIKNVGLIKKAYDSCLNLIDEFKPDLVIGTGGYVVFPIMQAAKKRGIKTFLHEQNSIPGKSNLALSNNINLIGVSFNSSLDLFPKAKEVFYSGNPCSTNAITAKKIDKKTLGLTENKKLILIVSGSLGSTTINDKFKIFLNLVEEENYEVIYVTGKNHYDNFIKGTNFPNNVQIKPFIDNLPGLMKSCDLVISRAGASTISEILALKKPSILIPSPYVANNHQYYNALDLKNMYVAELLEEKNLSAESLLLMINKVFEEKNNTLIKERLNNLKEEDSSLKIYNKIKEMMKNE